MQITKLLTYSFARNVGVADRALRMALGAAIAALPWLITLPLGIGYGVSTIGAMIFVTGIVSRCALYYLLGYSTCPASEKSDPFIDRS